MDISLLVGALPGKKSGTRAPFRTLDPFFYGFWTREVGSDILRRVFGPRVLSWQGLCFPRPGQFSARFKLAFLQRFVFKQQTRSSGKPSMANVVGAWTLPEGPSGYGCEKGQRLDSVCPGGSMDPKSPSRRQLAGLLLVFIAGLG